MNAAEADRARLLALLVEHSYAEREVTLSSGQKSNFYIDCKQTMLRGEGHALIGRSFLRLLADDPHPACGGLTMGADPLASALALTAYLGGIEMNAIYVRKEAKGHGTGAWLEGAGAVAPGSRVAVVEDVVTTGGASVKAIERLRAGGFAVDTVLAIVDREAGGREALAALGCKLHALFTVRDFPIGQKQP